jgi:hypothetical protein
MLALTKTRSEKNKNNKINKIARAEPESGIKKTYSILNFFNK